MPSRRTLIVSAATLSVAGCLQEPSAGESETPNATGTPTSTLDRNDDAVERSGWDRGRSDHVPHRQVDLEADENVRYVGDGRVEVVMARSADGPASTEEMPFEEWAPIACTSGAAEAAIEYVREQVEDGISTGIGSHPDEDGRLVPRVRHVTVVEDGETVSEPPISYDELRDRTPRSATGRATIDDLAHECRVPVLVKRLERGPIRDG